MNKPDEVSGNETAAKVALYHESIVTKFDSLPIKTPADQAIACEFAKFVGVTFTPISARDAVIASLGRLRQRVAKAQLPDDVRAVAVICAAIDSIKKQPAKKTLGAATDNAEEIPSGGFMASVPTVKAGVLDSFRN